MLFPSQRILVAKKKSYSKNPQTPKTKQYKLRPQNSLPISLGLSAIPHMDDHLNLYSYGPK